MDAVRGATQGLGAMMAERSAVVVFVVVTGLLAVLAVVYVVYRIKRTELQSATVLSRPVRLFNSDQAVTLDSSRLPGTLNGQEFAYSFWLYLAELQPAAVPYVIFHRASGVVTTSTVQANPVVMMNPQTNKMHICMRTNGSSTSGTTLSDIIAPKPGTPALRRWVVATIDYVPLQRWVHVAFVVSDNLLTVYMDGDMYTVENVMELADSAGAQRPIFAGTTGDIVVGPTPGSAELRGYVAKLQFFNYALTRGDVKDITSSGPSDSSVLASLGLPAYSLRSPIYRIDDA